MFKKHDIREACGTTYYNRGRRYADSGRVLSCNSQHEGQDILVEGSCLGSYHSLYEQSIQVSEIDDFFLIEGDCTCPVGFNCKHVAAVLIHMLEQHQPRVGAPAGNSVVDRLLQRLAEPEQPNVWLPQPGQDVLLYLLGSQPAGAPYCQVELLRARLLKNGKGLGKPAKLHAYDLRSRRVEALLQPLDREILKLLEASSHWQGFRLSGEVGGLAVPKMVQTGRAYWQDTRGTALESGPARQLRVDWQHTEQAYRLQVQTEPGGGSVLPLQPPYYIDPSARQVGPLLGGEAFAAGQLAVLVESPVVSDRDAEQLAQRLVTELPHLPLPLPTNVEVKEIKGERPQPVLQLLGIAAGELPGVERTVQFAVLLFDYRGERVEMPPVPLTTHKGSGGIRRVHRDMEREAQLVARLDDIDFADGQFPGGGIVFVPRADDLPGELAGWRRFVEQEVSELQREGWLIEQQPSFRLEFMDGEHLELEVEDVENGWFDLSLGIELEGRRVDLLPLLQPLLQRIDSPAELDDIDSGIFVPLGESRWAELPVPRIRPVIEVLFELFDRQSAGQETLRLSRLDAVRLAELDDQLAPEWRGGEALRELAQRLRTMDGLPRIASPEGLQAELRPYQEQGYAWLQFLRETGFGGILADDMGLGKTLQTLAHLLYEKEQGRLQAPVLVVAPTSLMANWRHEAQRFTPSLSVLVLQGPGRKADFGRIGDHDIVLTTYPLLPRDRQTLLAHDYHSVILDEAQTIKNPKAQAAQVACELKTAQRICLTGTPMENHLGELWSLFNFLAPGFLGEQRHFNESYRVPIEHGGDGERRQALQRRIAPFLLRRTKQQVAKELPEKIEIERSVALHKAQSELYESVRLAMDAKVREALKSKGLARSHITILDALLKLRQICCDPRLVKLDQARKVKHSAKLELLMEMLPELLEEGRRILLFSQFTSMLKLIEERLQKLGVGYSKLTGQTRKREQAIERFRSGEVPLFLISLKAGGVGLNLTEADTVIHYDPWWNPAVERQATDRAHRIGQQNTVFVYRLVTENTVEEKIIALQQRKAALADAIYRKDSGGAEMAFSEEDVAALLGPVK